MDYNFKINATETKNVFDVKVSIRDNDILLYNLQYQAMYNGTVLLDLEKLKNEVPNQQIRLDLITKTKELIKLQIQ